MKKLAILLIILSFSRIGVAYADTTTAANSSNYFFGVQDAEANLNQVLALLVGPAGTPGPAGIAGKDGLIGMNGVDGKDGLPGAPGVAGVAGKDGASILSAAFTGTQGTCRSGGTKFTDAAGTVTYGCNGANGSNGGNGAQGPAGPVGPVGPTGPQGAAGTGGGGGTLGYGQGEVQVGACETDSKVYIDVTREFDGTNFYFKSFFLGNPAVTDADITNACAGEDLSIWLKMGDTVAGKYLTNDFIKCSTTLPLTANWPAGVGSSGYQFDLDSTLPTAGSHLALNCVNQTSNQVISLSEIRTADFTGTIGVAIG